MLSFDISLIVQIIQTIVLAIILNALLIKPIMKNFEERRMRFQGLEREIEDYNLRAKELLEKYQQTLHEARSEGLKKQELLKEEARKIEREKLQAVMKEAEAKKKEWEKVFSREFEELRHQLLAQKETLANLIIEKLVGRRV
jgi:F-type H+-transporting ATPase subunit b